MADDAPPNPSLLARLGTLPPVSIGRRAAGIVAVLLILAPVATLLGAKLLTAAARHDAAAVAAAQGPRIAAARAQAAQRRALATVIDRPTLGTTLEGLARALPRETQLVRAGRGADGRLAIEASTADPDRLRAGLRRDPATAHLRDAGQRRGDAALVVAMDEP
ncbi:hypothetical protein M9980_08365 [Sphingomonas donggukensis]|uniref:Uncharacterized protein n=1 Tax=Sphingomonas donggukensis TaxID=2949093 RepID=A0ABY4TRY4_9SPHN|nr:hypothetical protein [Sphingomonas donggukensis]URW74590.1 hypothetical protein M9980_08365 [Sphingomonas donggukensis]